MQGRDSHCSDRVYKPRRETIKRNHNLNTRSSYTYLSIDPLKEKQLRHYIYCFSVGTCLSKGFCMNQTCKAEGIIFA